mgnify:FL=1
MSQNQRYAIILLSLSRQKSIGGFYMNRLAYTSWEDNI